MKRTSGLGPRQLTEIAVALAAGAAGRARRWRSRFDGPLHATHPALGAKSTATDLVTQADTATEDWIVSRLATLRPEDDVLGEEGGSRRPAVSDSEVRWVIDPIDGTVNFVLGLPQSAVSVAVEVAGTIVGGAVANIATGELFWGFVGSGAWLGMYPELSSLDNALSFATRIVGDPSSCCQRLHGPRPVSLDAAVVGTGFAYDRQRRQAQAAVVAALLPEVADIRRYGAASLDLCAVAAGRLDAYYERGLSAWDYAAGLVIAAEAGCTTSPPTTLAVSEHDGLTIAAGTEIAGPLASLLGRLHA